MPKRVRDSDAAAQPPPKRSKRKRLKQTKLTLTPRPKRPRTTAKRTKRDTTRDTTRENKAKKKTTIDDVRKTAKKLLKDKLIGAHDARRALEWFKIVQPDVAPRVFCKWSEEEWRSQHDDLRQKHNDYIRESMPKKLQPIKESLIQCPKCHKNATHLDLVQTRSADEPMTEKCTCTACGHKWRNN